MVPVTVPANPPTVVAATAVPATLSMVKSPTAAPAPIPVAARAVPPTMQPTLAKVFLCLDAQLQVASQAAPSQPAPSTNSSISSSKAMGVRFLFSFRLVIVGSSFFLVQLFSSLISFSGVSHRIHIFATDGIICLFRIPILLLLL